MNDVSTLHFTLHFIRCIHFILSTLCVLGFLSFFDSYDLSPYARILTCSAFQCEEPDCGKFFTRHDNLLQHRRSHRGHPSTMLNLSGTSGAACSVPGPFGRIYTDSTLARESHQRQQATTLGPSHPIDTTLSDSSAPAPATMGVLLPSPLSTVPVPSMYGRISIDESQTQTATADSSHGTGHRSPPTSNSAGPSHSMSPLKQNQAYHTSHPSHSRRHSGSMVGTNELVHAVTTESSISGHSPPTPSSVSASSPTSATSTSSPFTLNYDYTNSVAGSLSATTEHQSGQTAYLSAVSCYYEDHTSHIRSSHTHDGDVSAVYSGYHVQPHYSSAGVPLMATHGSHYHHQQAPFVHISVPVQGDMMNGRGSFLQWRV